jgi:hypothetical protein
MLSQLKELSDNPPEAPVQWGNSEAAAWQSGFSSGVDVVIDMMGKGMDEELWKALKQECCANPEKAIRCVIVEREAFMNAAKKILS